MKKWLFLALSLFFIAPLYAEPLPAAQVFQVEVKKIDPNTFSVNWTIKPNYFLYSDRISLSSESEDDVTIGPLRLPLTETKTDKQGHVYTVYRNHLTLPVDVLGASPGESIIKLNYQGCSDDGFCYPPETQEIKIGIDSDLGLATVNLEENPIATNTVEEEPSTPIAQVFTDHNWFMILLIFYGFGLLLSFTPCILPMVPVLSGIIVGHGKEITTRKAFLLSLSYVLSMSITYAILGAVVALLGQNLQISMQSPWAIGVFSFIFILLALSMFGFYEFKLPESWQSKIAGSSGSQKGGHYFGAAIMGCLSTLILSPCVTAPLIGVLGYIAQSNNIILGSLTLFVLSLGMGTPLLLIGTSAGKLLPKSGSWMNGVKAFFGVLLLAVALYLLERILPSSLTMFLWACLFIFSGVYAGALSSAVTHQEKGKQSIGIILLVYGLLILVGTSMGATNPLQPLALLKEKMNAPLSNNRLNETQTLALIQQEIEAAKGTPVVLDFYADWCSSCKVMESTTFQDPEVKQLVTHFKWIKVDVTQNNSENQKIMRYFDVIAPPSFLFFNKQGKPMPQLKTVGELTASQFIKILEKAK